MQSYLVINSPWQSASNSSRWSFSGAEDRVLQSCLDQLDEFSAPDVEDRWTATVVFGFLDHGADEIRRAWTAEGAERLAELLPDELADVRGDIEQRLAARLAEADVEPEVPAPAPLGRHGQGLRRPKPTARQDIAAQLEHGDDRASTDPEK